MNSLEVILARQNDCADPACPQGRYQCTNVGSVSDQRNCGAVGSDMRIDHAYHATICGDVFTRIDVVPGLLKFAQQIVQLVGKEIEVQAASRPVLLLSARWCVPYRNRTRRASKQPLVPREYLIPVVVIAEAKHEVARFFEPTPLPLVIRLNVLSVVDRPVEERFAELKETLAEQFAEAEELSALIQTKLEEIA